MCTGRPPSTPVPPNKSWRRPPSSPLHCAPGVRWPTALTWSTESESRCRFHLKRRRGFSGSLLVMGFSQQSCHPGPFGFSLLGNGDCIEGEQKSRDKRYIELLC